MKNHLLTAMVVSLELVAPAFAGTITVDGYSLPYPKGYGSVSVSGVIGSVWYASPFEIDTSSGDFYIYCSDPLHTIYPDPTTYTYAVESLTENGLGGAISQPVSNEIGQIAAIGIAALGADPALAVAAQGAIWSLAYGETATSTDATVETDITNLLNAQYSNNGLWAEALVPQGEDWPTNPGASQELVTGALVPESSTWAMMLLGFAGLGFAGYRSSRNSRSIAA